MNYPGLKSNAVMIFLKRLRYSPLAFLPMIGQMGLIFWMSGRSLPHSVQSFPDWLMHGICYAVLTYFAWLGFSGVRLFPSFNPDLLLSFALAVGYGVTDEWHQYYVPMRDASGKDIIANMLGSLLAVIVIYIYLHSTSKEGGPRP